MSKVLEVEHLLRINGLSATSDEAAIRNALMEARYTDEEIEELIVQIVSRDKSAKQASLNKVLRTDAVLTPGEVSQLLGVEIVVSDRIEARRRRQAITLNTQVALSIISIVAALIGVCLYMYILEMGIFHPTSELSFASLIR